MRAVVVSLLGLFVVPPLYGADYPMRAEAVAEGVYAVVTPTRDLPNPENRGWNSNSAFVITGDGVLVFDTGSSTAIGEALKATIASVTDQPVRWIVNSHAHGDHWLGNAAFGDTVEKIYATKTVAAAVKIGGSNWVRMFNDMTGGVTGDSEIVEPDTFIDERVELDLGGTEVVLFPGNSAHSPGDLIMWLPQSRVLAGGDIVYSDRMPSTNNSALQSWLEMLDTLQQLQPAKVIAGHGVVTDAAGLARLETLLTDLWDAVAAAYDEGMADFEMLPVVQQALSAYADEFPGLEEKLPRDLPHVFLQVEAAAF